MGKYMENMDLYTEILGFIVNMENLWDDHWDIVFTMV